MATSQNGYPVSADRNAIGIRTFKVPGAEHVLLPLRADIAPLILEMARWWHVTVEPLVVPGCWAYAYREIRGATGWSNHASGTAADLNAPKHPLGVRGTLGNKRDAVIAKAKALGLRSGAAYTGRPDDMHVELDVSLARALQLVAQLQTPPEDDMSQKDVDELKYKVHQIWEAMGQPWVKNGHQWIGRIFATFGKYLPSDTDTITAAGGLAKRLDALDAKLDKLAEEIRAGRS